LLFPNRTFLLSVKGAFIMDERHNPYLWQFRIATFYIGKFMRGEKMIVVFLPFLVGISSFVALCVSIYHLIGFLWLGIGSLALALLTYFPGYLINQWWESAKAGWQKNISFILCSFLAAVHFSGVFGFLLFIFIHIDGPSKLEYFIDNYPTR
jgi:hypothetical protein